VITGGEVQGQGKAQGLTVVLLRYVSRMGMAGMVKFDWDPRRRRRVDGDDDVPAVNVGHDPVHESQ
jgi:hypothetical protein